MRCLRVEGPSSDAFGAGCIPWSMNRRWRPGPTFLPATEKTNLKIQRPRQAVILAKKSCAADHVVYYGRIEMVRDVIEPGTQGQAVAAHRKYPFEEQIQLEVRR